MFSLFMDWFNSLKTKWCYTVIDTVISDIHDSINYNFNIQFNGLVYNCRITVIRYRTTLRIFGFRKTCYNDLYELEVYPLNNQSVKTNGVYPSLSFQSTKHMEQRVMTIVNHHLIKYYL